MKPARAVAVGAAGTVAAIALVLAVHWLIRETVTRHSPVAPDSALVVVFSTEKRAGEDVHPDAPAEALASMCSLEVRSRLVPASFQVLGDRRYRFELRPALDRADRRQLEGCLEDLRIDHVLGELESMEERSTRAGPPPG